MAVGGWQLRAHTALDGSLTIEGYAGGQMEWHVPVQTRSVSAELATSVAGEPPSLVMLQRSYSRIDGEDGIRLFTYGIGQGGLYPRWRGSALGWPLVDISVLHGDRT